MIKDFGAEGIYRGGAREPFHEHAASGVLPRLSLISDELSSDELAELYRSCDVLVHPTGVKASECRCSRRWPARFR